MGRLAEAVDATSDRKGGVECSIHRVLREMSEEDRVDFNAYLRDMDVSATRLTNVLNDMKFDVNVYAVRKHRNRVLHRSGTSCRCPIGDEGE